MRDSKAGATSVRRPRTGSGRTATTAYDKDVILWSREQARLLRAGRFSELDIESGRRDRRHGQGRKARAGQSNGGAAGASPRMEPPTGEPQRSSWRTTINDQRKRTALAIKETPSLKTVMRDRDWPEDMWLDALAQAEKETGLAGDNLSESCPVDGSGQRFGFLAGVKGAATLVI